ncbi:unnamed protein product [Urochloa humidicola]
MAHDLLSMAAILAAAATLLVIPAAAYPWPVCGGISSFNPNSTYQANLNLLAATLPKNASASPSLYATAIVGTNPDQVRAMGLCRGDTANATDCLTCLTEAFQDLANDCSYDKDATIYYDPCILHYAAAHALPGGNDTSSGTINYSTNVTSDPDQFERLLAALMNATAEQAANNSARRFATGEADFNQEFPKVYSLAQCTPDQTAAQCWKCLAGIVAANYMRWFGSSIGGRVLALRCNYRYETAPFFNGPAMVRMASPISAAPAPAPAAQAPVGTPALASRVGSKHKVLIVLAVSITVFFAVLVGCLMLIIRRRKEARKTKLQLRPTFPINTAMEEALRLWRTEESSSEFTLYDFSELAAATGGFSDGNRLGTGGFGPVYKGKLGDREVAVKRLASHSGQGLQEFKNEIQLIAKLQHTNLVRLLGCCVQKDEKMLVYEYMPNGSLDFFIFDQDRGALLDWKKRVHIIEGIAQGLLYLHKHSRVRIIHRDLKASNVLLDKYLNSKISDFGMARIFASNMTVANTNRIVGTYGYMAPEYGSEGIFSIRSDVFSFGVLLLEIITGKRNNRRQHYGGFINLHGYAWRLWKEGRAFELIDPTLVGNNEVTSILRFIKVALLCVQDKAIDRPSMTEWRCWATIAQCYGTQSSRPTFT